MKEFWEEHKVHCLVVLTICGHQVVNIFIGVDAGEHYFFLFEILHSFL